MTVIEVTYEELVPQEESTPHGAEETVEETIEEVVEELPEAPTKKPLKAQQPKILEKHQDEPDEVAPQGEESMVFAEEEAGFEVEPKCPKPKHCDDDGKNYKALYEALLKGHASPSVVHSTKRDVNINIIVN